MKKTLKSIEVNQQKLKKLEEKIQELQMDKLALEKEIENDQRNALSLQMSENNLSFDEVMSLIKEYGQPQDEKIKE